MSTFLTSRRRLLAAGLGGLFASIARAADPKDVTVPGGAKAEAWDFAGKGIEGWTVVDGQWSVQDGVLMQRATSNTFNVIVSPLGPYSDVDVTMRFKPISGREDASGGIVFRFAEGRYYLIRANALEDNFRFYYYDRGRTMLSSARVRAPALGQWHTVRAVAIGDHVQGWLDGALLLDHRDHRFRVGRVGLWTKADSVTAFEQLSIRGMPAV